MLMPSPTGPGLNSAFSPYTDSPSSPANFNQVFSNRCGQSCIALHCAVLSCVVSTVIVVVYTPLRRGTGRERQRRTPPSLSASSAASASQLPRHLSRFFVRCSHSQPSLTATPTPTQPNTPPPPIALTLTLTLLCCADSITPAQPTAPNSSIAPDRVTVRSPCRLSTPTARTA